MPRLLLHSGLIQIGVAPAYKYLRYYLNVLCTQQKGQIVRSTEENGAQKHKGFTLTHVTQKVMSHSLAVDSKRVT